MTDSVARYPDPQGMISRVRARLPRNSSVRMSQFCDHIIAMRLQGVPYHGIEKWLQSKGKEFRIPAATIWRNFKATKIKIVLPYAEELAEKWGGGIDIDLARELSRQILVQRNRVDHMVIQEAEKRKTSPMFTNKLIRAEMETLNNLIHSMTMMLKSPMEAADERARAESLLKKVGGELELNEAAQNTLVDMILSGDLKIGGGDEPKPVGAVS